LALSSGERRHRRPTFGSLSQRDRCLLRQCRRRRPQRGTRAYQRQNTHRSVRFDIKIRPFRSEPGELLQPCGKACAHGGLHGARLSLAPSRGLRRLGRRKRDGSLVRREDAAVGLENAPGALLRLFAGENSGKQLVIISNGSEVGQPSCDYWHSKVFEIRRNTLWWSKRLVRDGCHQCKRVSGHDRSRHRVGSAGRRLSGATRTMRSLNWQRTCCTPSSNAIAPAMNVTLLVPTGRLPSADLCAWETAQHRRRKFEAYPNLGSRFSTKARTASL
jgi:hypothetical protein